MKALLSRWGRRWIAGLLAIAMLSGMIPTALASETPLDTTSDTETELLLEAASETEAESVPETTTETVPETTAETVPETTAETVPETTAETVPETTAETVPETTAETVPETTAETESEEELSEEELEELLLLEGGEMALFSTRSSETATPALTDIPLADAIEIAKRIANGSTSLNLSDDAITVQSSADLILLSYVKPEDYSDYTINLSLVEEGIDFFNLVDPVYDTVDGETFEYKFRGLGGIDAPFAGTIVTSSPKPIRTARALFNSLSTDAEMQSDGNALQLQFEILEQAVDGPIFATEIVPGVGSANWEIGLSGSASIGGIIGTMTGGTVTLEANLSNWNKETDSGTTSPKTNLTCSGNSDAGFFCNTMTDGTLNATLSGTGSVSVTAESGSAGGFVGNMKDGCSLTASINGADAKITGVTAKNGSAGGLVGMAVKSVVATQESYTLSGITVTGKNAGGLIGSCTGWNNETKTIDLSKLPFIDSLTLSGVTAGGVFGALTNSGGTLTMEGNTEVKSVGSATTYGGLIGTYASSDRGLSDTLEIKSLTVTSNRTGGSNYGGIIGTLPTTCYVKMSGLTAKTSGIDGTFGGLVAEAGSTTSAVLLDVNGADVSVTSGGINGGVTGGLVGKLSKGVLRLDGAITVPDIAPGEKKGRIVGENGDGLVYAVSNDWTPTTTSTASNIGNWGEVVRLDGTTLTGDSDAGNLFYLNPNTHTLTISKPAASDGKYTLNGTADFVGYALAYNYDSNDVLNFDNDVDPTVSQDVKLNGLVDLSGTGILGIGRDNGYSDPFTGTFDGGNCTITLDIGDTAGKLWARQKKSDPDSHGYLGLFARVGNGAQIQKVTVNGTVNMSVLNGTDGNANENPLRVAGLVAHQVGSVSYNAVTASAAVTVDTDVTNTPYVMQAGMVAFCDENSTLNFTDCNWTSTLTNSRTNSNDRSGGFLAHTKGGITLTAVNCTLSGNINHSDKTSDARVGGLVADIEENSTNPSQITLKNLTVSATVSAAKAGKNNYCGGLLGCHWYSTNVVFVGDGVKGVTVSGASLNAGSAKFGGLVYQATGHWDATANESIKFTGTDGKKTTITATTGDHRGLLVGDGLHDAPKKALYLEVGTWGEEGTAYWIDSSNVRLVDANGTPLSGQFDELVGAAFYGKSDNKPASPGFYENNNAIISLTTKDTTEIDNGTCNTYTKQLTNVISNYQARYYYNLSNMSDTETAPSTLTTAQQVTTWSASQFAASNIRTILYAGANNPVTISNEGNTAIDLTHYSYYPVSPLSTVTVQNATLKFGFDVIEGVEAAYNEGAGNKKPSDSEHQHYLMQCGLLYNTTRNVTVEDVTLSGVVGNPANNASGALIYGKVTGDTTKSPATVPTVKLSNVTLAGLRVKDVGVYAPLLINTIAEAVTLTVDGLWTGEGYVKNDITQTAATSLIGNVGSDSATKLKLTFANIALDSRTTPGSNIYVKNNGLNDAQVKYYTFQSIFTQATLLNSFKYTSESSGVYNFYNGSSYYPNGEFMITYGYEISNTNDGRNQQEQYEYFDVATNVWDGERTLTSIAEYYRSGYLPYVKEHESGNTHELDVNKKPKNLDKGCGTYGDPYIITDGKQLVALAKYLQGNGANGFEVTFNTEILNDSSKAAEVDYYHIRTDNLPTDVTYTLTDGHWINGDERLADGDTFGDYLRNAYYQVQGTIHISDSDWAGLGTDTDAFSGVIVGKDSDARVEIHVSNNTVKQFGGLIRYSRGSVVKDLTVDYTEAQITMTNGSVDKNVFFGGVVGYCMGGDTIIDNVSVNYGPSSITLPTASDQKPRLIAAGGYVGLIGGAKDSSGYEKTGGGVVFRSSLPCNFDVTVAEASKSAPRLMDDGTAHDGSGSTYFYCNPFVGRVLDGYACYDNPDYQSGSAFTLNNTDKNYTIPDLAEGTSGLEVDENYNVTVNNAQGLWLLSAIVNSGAGAMDGTGSYTDVSGTVDAYQTGKPRSGKYDKIGTADGVSDLADEAYWGGAGAHDSGRVSYLVKKFTDAASDGTYHAAQVCGGTDTANNPVALRFGNATIDMSSYGNGFRGIGASFGDYFTTWNMGETPWNKLYRRTLYVMSVAGAENAGTVITLNTNQHDYIGEYNASTGFNQSAGLFTMFSYANGCEVDGLTIGGNVRICMYDDSGKLSNIAKSNTDICVGGFAGRTINAAGTVTFTNFHLNGLRVYGGTSTGGVFGLTEKSGGKKTIQFTETWSITGDTHISKYVTNDGLTGGLIGWSYGGGGVTIEGYGSSTGANTRWNVDDLTVSIQATQITGSGLNAGGLIGGSNDPTNTINNVNARDIRITGKGAKDYGGLVGGMDSATTITNCKLEGVTVNPTGGKNVGGVAGRTKGLTLKKIAATGIAVSNADIGSSDAGLGGLVGLSEGSLDITECQVTGSIAYSASADNKIKGRVGGLIGVSKNTTTIASSTLSSVDILAKAEFVGGLIGRTDGGSATIRNVTLSNVIAAKQTDKPIGLIAGEDGQIIKGYNILADSCKVGYNASATMGNLHSADLTDDGSTGLWLGKSTSSSTFVAVAIKGTNQPQKDIGVNPGTASIVYADYPVDQGNKPTTGSASPWLDVNPKIEVGGLTLTGNGVGYHTTQETQTVDGIEKVVTVLHSYANAILEEAKSENAATRKYWNVKDAGETDLTFSKFLDPNNNNYLTTYQAEEGATTTAKNVDFPILVLASNADADTVLWTYIAALTNVSSGTVAKAQASGVTATTYKWNGSAFVKHTSPSLTVNDKKISTVKNQYDNQDSRFTLLDVKYKNPTTTTTNAAGDYFHLYVPVLVKKVLRVKYTIKMLAGTNYYADGYSGAAYYATANFNEPVTALIEYNYDRPIAEWNDALNNGEDLLWHYKKVFDLKSNGTNLPMGTRLTLVDVATGKASFYTMQGSENNNYFDCEEEKKLGFSPLPICDYLEISVSDTGKTPYVELPSENGATVKVGDTYYRPATTEEKSDSKIEKRYLTVGGMKRERYFLTIQVPETAGITFINNLLDLPGSAMVRTENAPPAVKEQEYNNGRYVLYDGVAQSNFTIKTERVGGSGTEMTGGDAIRVQLSSELRLTDAAKARYKEGYKPVDLNHRFTIDLKKVVGGNTTESVLGVTGISWNYTVVGKDGQELGTSGQRTYTPGELDSFSVSSGSYFNAGNMVTWIEKYEPLKVKAEIILQYGNNVGSVFPARTGENSSDGSYVHAESRVANAESQLPITANKLKADGQELYYCVTPSSASLTFDAIEPSGGEKTLQLGINSDDDYQPRIIQTDSIYDYSEVDPVTVSKAKYVRYTLELFRKQNNGLYNGDALSRINEYLPIVREAGVSRVDKTSADGSKMTWTEPLDAGATCDSTSFDFVPLTGAAFEEKGFTYANYMIRLTAELLEEKQDNGTIVKEVLPGTLASDYIVYTNARVLQKIPDDTNP